VYQQRIKTLTINNFGPFVGEHSVQFPTNGLVLIKGKVTENGDGSGAGKSYLLNSIPYILGGCPFSANELQSWYTDEPPSAEIVLETSKGDAILSRKKGLVLKADFLKDVYKGKAAEAELDTLLGMDAKTRAQVTYRPQRKPGLFLSMSDPDKKAFLSKLLELEKYEKLAEVAQKSVSKLEADVKTAESIYKAAFEVWEQALVRFNEFSLDNSLSALVESRDSAENLIKTKKAEQQTVLEDIETVRTSNNQELEAVLEGTRSKIAKINTRGESLEVSAGKKELSEVQKELEVLKEAREEARRQVQKEKEAISQAIKDLRVLSDKAIAETSAKANVKMAELDGKIALIRDAASKLLKLQDKEQKLLKSLCPTCGQQWIDAQKELLAVREQILVEQENIKTLEKLQSDRVKLKGLLADFIGKKNKELAESIVGKELALEGIVFVENPLVPAKSQQVADLFSKIKEMEQLDRTKKQQDMEVLFLEEKKIKQEFSGQLDVKVASYQNRYKQIGFDISEINGKLGDINSNIAHFRQQEALKKDRQVGLDKAAEALGKALAERDRLSGKYALEADVVALVGYRGFLGAIFSDVLVEIAYQTNDILGKVANVRHVTIDFETEKEAASSGNVVARITPVMYIGGRKVSFDAGISGGMQTAVELAVDLAVGNVVSCRRNTYPNFLILDESLHGLGGVAKESCIEMLQSVAGDRLVLVVDHSTEFCNLFNQVIEVEQTEGISRIIT
jgi:DNA repair exonuclease SbcCD ATPase subunit